MYKENDIDDPVIRQEMEGRNNNNQPPASAAAYYTQPVDVTNQESNQDIGYNTFEEKKYPVSNDDYVKRQLYHDDNEKQGRWNCLDIFSKLKGEDERQGFLIKVLSILTLQIFMTVILISIVWLNQGLKDYLQDNIWVYIVALVLTIVVL